MNPLTINNFKEIKNIPVLIIDKKITFINNKAKEILNFSTENEKIIFNQIKNTILKKKHTFEITINNQVKFFNLEYESFTENGIKKHVCILFDVTNVLSESKEIKEQINLYDQMFDALPIGILVHQSGKLQYVNKYGMELIEAKNKQQYLGYNIINFLIHKKDVARAASRITSKKQYIPPEIFEIKTFKNNPKTIELYSYYFPFIKNNNKEENVRLLIFIDKTEELEKQQVEIDAKIKQHENKLLKKQNEIKEKILKELQIKQEQLFNTINQSEYLFWITDAHLNVVLFNHAFYDYCRKYYNISLKVGDNTIVLQEKMNESEHSTALTRQQVIDKILNSKKEYTYEINHFDKQLNKKRIYKITFKPIFEKNKKIKNYYCYGHEITEKYEFINQIQQQSVKLNEIIEHSPIYLWSMNQKQELTLFNNNYLQLITKLYGHPPKIGKKLIKGKYDNNKEFIESINYHYKKAFEGSIENFQLSFDIEANKQITLDVNLFPIIVNGEVQEVSGIATNITEEKEKQRQLQNLLLENEILMKEVHHRIKNNLQVISSMINLQIQNQNHEHIQQTLRDTQNRVYSMAIIHQTLYQNKNYTSINITNTIHELIQNILFSFNKTDIHIHKELDEIILDVNTAIPLALIINEALTNIVKYAFPPPLDIAPHAHIVLKRNNLDIELLISDNGIGIAKEEFNNIMNTGFTIIKALAEQINGRLHITSEYKKGTHIKLLIPQF